jgi:Zn-dependent protease
MSDEHIWTPVEAPAFAGPTLVGAAPAGQPPVSPVPPVLDEPAFAAAPTQLPGAAEDPFGRKPERGRLRNRIASVIAALVALAAKFGTALKAILVALPNLKLFATMGTGLIAVASYSLFFGWPLAAVFVVLIFVHEMGHVIQLRREGIKASAPMFIPFMGAFIAAKSLGENALAEARVGLAGPILGSLGAACVAIAGVLLHSDLLLAAAYLGFLINLINLIPVVPFDGGRAMAAVAPVMWFLGLAGLVAIGVLLHNPFVLVFIVLAMFEFPRRWSQLRSRSLASAAYYRVPKRSRVLVGLLYVGLAVALLLGMDATHILYSNGHYLGNI